MNSFMRCVYLYSMTLSTSTKMAEYYHIPTEILDDLSSRFIINIPEEERKDLIRLCFQVELAHWFYMDFYCAEERRGLKLCGMKEFAVNIFGHIPSLQTHVPTIDVTLDRWKIYKQNVPTFGGAILNETMDKVLLVQSYWAKHSWGFPKGKVNEGEDPSRCAIREVLEETGFDMTDLVSKDEYIDASIREQMIRLYIVTGVSMDTKFAPRTRKEIKKIGWFSLADLPTNKKDMTTKQHWGVGPNAFFMVVPFVKRLRKWVAEKQHRDRMAEMALSVPSSVEEIVPASAEEGETAVQSSRQQLSIAQATQDDQDPETLPVGIIDKCRATYAVPVFMMASNVEELPLVPHESCTFIEQETKTWNVRVPGTPLPGPTDKTKVRDADKTKVHDVQDETKLVPQQRPRSESLSNGSPNNRPLKRRIRPVPYPSAEPDVLAYCCPDFEMSLNNTADVDEQTKFAPVQKIQSELPRTDSPYKIPAKRRMTISSMSTQPKKPEAGSWRIREAAQMDAQTDADDATRLALKQRMRSECFRTDSPYNVPSKRRMTISSGPNQSENLQALQPHWRRRETTPTDSRTGQNQTTDSDNVQTNSDTRRSFSDAPETETLTGHMTMSSMLSQQRLASKKFGFHNVATVVKGSTKRNLFGQRNDDGSAAGPAKLLRDSPRGPAPVYHPMPVQGNRFKDFGIKDEASWRSQGGDDLEDEESVLISNSSKSLMFGEAAQKLASDITNIPSPFGNLQHDNESAFVRQSYPKAQELPPEFRSKVWAHFKFDRQAVLNSF